MLRPQDVHVAESPASTARPVPSQITSVMTVPPTPGSARGPPRADPRSHCRSGIDPGDLDAAAREGRRAHLVGGDGQGAVLSGDALAGRPAQPETPVRLVGPVAPDVVRPVQR